MVGASSTLYQLLGQILDLQSFTTPRAMAPLLMQFREHIPSSSNKDLSARLEKVAQAMLRGAMHLSDWKNSALRTDLARLHAAMENGLSLGEALRVQSSRLDQITGGGQTPAPLPVRHPLMPIAVPATSNEISDVRWKTYGSQEHPAPQSPGPKIKTAGQRLTYFCRYIVLHALNDDSESAIERFFEITSNYRIRIRDSQFIPKNLGDIPSEIMERMIAKAAGVEPKYGELMRLLFIHAIFESQRWHLQRPVDHAPWHEHLLYDLQHYYAGEILSVEGSDRVRKDADLFQVVRKRARLEDCQWHTGSGRTRREVLESWLQAMHHHDPAALERHSLFIGNGILRLARWEEPPETAEEAYFVQWFLRYWFAHYHYGALPMLVVTEQMTSLLMIKGMNPRTSPGPASAASCGVSTLQHRRCVEGEAPAALPTEGATQAPRMMKQPNLGSQDGRQWIRQLTGTFFSEEEIRALRLDPKRRTP